MDGGKEVTTIQQSPQQIALQSQQLDLAREQLNIVREQHAQQTAAFEKLEPFYDAQHQELLHQQERARALEPIQDELLERTLEEIRRGGAASPEQMAAIDEATQHAQARGEIDINRYRDESLSAVANELAPSRGLRPGDTPILDSSGRVAAESLRQQGALTESLAGAKASAALNYPLAVSQTLGAQSQFQQGLANAQNQFQAQLRDAALNNRLRAAGTQGGLGVSLASAASPNSGFFQPLGTTTSHSTGFLGGLSNVLNGLGNAAQGVGAIWG